VRLQRRERGAGGDAAFVRETRLGLWAYRTVPDGGVQTSPHPLATGRAVRDAAEQTSHSRFEFIGADRELRARNDTGASNLIFYVLS